jgi:hypothetical protein
MAVFGEIIKRAVEVADEWLKQPNPAKAQKEQLKMLLENAQTTAFGQRYQFGTLLESKDMEKAFAESVPYHSYDKIYEEWWHRVVDGEPDITWPGRVTYFAVSSGTTSARKRIPVTEQMNKAIAEAEKAFDVNIKEFTVSAVEREEQYTHQWCLGVEGNVGASSEALAETIDNFLRSNNKNYNVARDKALKGIGVSIVQAEMFSRWTEETKQKGGQVKVPRVMAQDDFKAFIDFVDNNQK